MAQPTLSSFLKISNANGFPFDATVASSTELSTFSPAPLAVSQELLSTAIESSVFVDFVGREDLNLWYSSHQNISNGRMGYRSTESEKEMSDLCEREERGGGTSNSSSCYSGYIQALNSNRTSYDGAYVFARIMTSILFSFRYIFLSLY